MTRSISAHLYLWLFLLLIRLIPPDEFDYMLFLLDGQEPGKGSVQGEDRGR